MITAKKDILKAMYNSLDWFDITFSEIAISAGSALLMHGLREYTSDVDLIANEYTYQKLLDAGLMPCPIRKTLIDVTPMVSVQIETEFEVNTTLIDGLIVLDCKSLLAQKKNLLKKFDRSHDKLNADAIDLVNLTLNIAKMEKGP